MYFGLNRKEEKRLYESPVSLAAKIPSLLCCDCVKTRVAEGASGESAGSGEQRRGRQRVACRGGRLASNSAVGAAQSHTF